jgi:hypothetical protein
MAGADTQFAESACSVATAPCKSSGSIVRYSHPSSPQAAVRAVQIFLSVSLYTGTLSWCPGGAPSLAPRTPRRPQGSWELAACHRLALFREIERGFETGGGFLQLHGGGIDGGDEERPIECVACADAVDVFAFSDEGFLHPLLAEIAQVAILAHLLAHLCECECFLLLCGLFG